MRNVLISFRMLPQEANNLNQQVALSGLTKQDYIIKCLLEREVRVVCGRKVAREMQEVLEALLEELQYLEEGVVPSAEIMEPLKNVLEILNTEDVENKLENSDGEEQVLWK